MAPVAEGLLRNRHLARHLPAVLPALRALRRRLLGAHRASDETGYRAVAQLRLARWNSATACGSTPSAALRRRMTAGPGVVRPASIR